jgi:hypothetical protein
LGGHVEECNQCGHRLIAYNSCRNRHCPKCQGAERAQWLAERQAELLEVEYFHLVYTLPDALGPVALQNQRVIYKMLFRATAESLLEIAADPQHLGADIGFVAVLHTWGQQMQHHPHIHCVVPGGGTSPDGARWVKCRSGFFLPVRVLSRLFRGKLLSLLAGVFRQGQLGFHGRLEHLADATAFAGLLDELRQTECVVYAKPPFGGPERVLKYLARYTHRVAISNGRLIEMEDGKVRFHWKDYARGNESKTMQLEAVEFIRRFLLHVVPKGFVRIRHYGLLANRHREEKLALSRQLLGSEKKGQVGKTEVAKGEEEGQSRTEPWQRCPVCQEGVMEVVGPLEPQRQQIGDNSDQSGPVEGNSKHAADQIAGPAERELLIQSP